MMSLIEFAEMSQTKATKAQIKTALACFLEYVQTGQAADTPVHADPIAQFFIDHPGISLSKSARMLGIPRTTLKRRYDVLVSTGMIS